MPTVTDYKQQRASLLDENEDIFATAEAEERDLTDEEASSVEKNLESIDSIDKKIELKEKQLKAQAKVDTPDEERVDKQTTTRVSDQPEVDWRRRAVRYFNALVTKKDNNEEGERMLNKLRREVEGISDEQWLTEDKEAARTIDDSDLPSQKKHTLKSVLELRLHTTSTSDTPKAGYLLPKPFLAEVFVIVEQYGVARRNFMTIPMISKDLDLKNVSTKVVSYWTDEGSNITASDLVFAEGQLTNKKLAGLTSWTTELEEDMAISLLPVVAQLFAESIAKKEDEAAFIGDGSSTYGSFTGLGNLGSAEYVTGGSGETTPAFLAEEDLRAAKNALSEARQVGAKWFMHRTVWDAICKLEDGGGNRIVQENLRNNAEKQLLGFPVETVEVMPTYTGASADTPFIILGNPMRALMGLRRGVTADISREAIIQNGSGTVIYNAFQGDGALLRITERVGFKVPSAYEDAFAVVQTAAS